MSRTLSYTELSMYSIASVMEVLGDVVRGCETILHVMESKHSP